MDIRKGSGFTVDCLLRKPNLQTENRSFSPSCSVSSVDSSSQIERFDSSLETVRTTVEQHSTDILYDYVQYRNSFRHVFPYNMQADTVFQKPNNSIYLKSYGLTRTIDRDVSYNPTHTRPSYSDLPHYLQHYHMWPSPPRRQLIENAWISDNRNTINRYNTNETEVLLSHFRKPKRIRTAFSPSQLLQMEHAFENNHYVVGHERKELAVGLRLSETQVKVWFQNRRTKYKRMKAEEEMTRSLTRKLEQKRKYTQKKISSNNTKDVSSGTDLKASNSCENLI